MLALARAVPALRSPLLGSSGAPGRRAARTALACRNMVVQLHSDIQQVLLTKETIEKRVHELGREIAADYADKRPVIIGTLKGAVLFMSDLVRAMDPMPAGLQLEFVRASSYSASTISSGKVALNMVGATDIKGRHVLLVEDIVDSGHTAAALLEHFCAVGAASVKLASLLSKRARRVVDFEADYLCFEVEDNFVVGYGLDFAEQYRSLPYIGILKPECYRGNTCEL